MDSSNAVELYPIMDEAPLLYETLTHDVKGAHKYIVSPGEAKARITAILKKNRKKYIDERHPLEKLGTIHQRLTRHSAECDI